MTDEPKPYVPQPGDDVVVVLEDWGGAEHHVRGRLKRIEPAEPDGESVWATR